VALDVVDLDRVGDVRLLVEVAKVAGEVREVGDPLAVELEVADVGRIEADQGHEQAPVCLGDRGAGQEPRISELPLKPVECEEDPLKGLLVDILAGREAGPVDTVVDLVVDAFVELVDLFPSVLRIEVDLGVAPLVPFGVEHADNFGALVVDGPVLLLVPEERDGHPG